MHNTTDKGGAVTSQQSRRRLGSCFHCFLLQSIYFAVQNVVLGLSKPCSVEVT